MAILGAVIGQALPVGAQTTHPILEPKGFQQNRAYFSEAPFEHIDTMSGALILTYTDLVLPGNAGWDLRFQRTFNSKRFKWTFGIADLPLYLTTTLNGKTPVLADGTEVVLYGGDTSYHISRDFWRFYFLEDRLLLPNGRSCVYSGLRVRECVDTFGNRVTFTWGPAATPGVAVTQYLGAVQVRQVQLRLDLDDLSQAFPTEMAFLGRTWRYQGTRTPAGLELREVVPPVGPSWRYAPVAQQTLATTTPSGGVVTYTFDLEQWQAGLDSQGFPITYSTRVVRDRDTSGTLPTGNWHYEYVFAGDSFSGTTTVDTPSARQTYTHKVAPLVLPGTIWTDEVLLTERRVQARQGNGNNYNDVEREQRSYQNLPLGPAVALRTITRDGQSFTTRDQYDLNGPFLADFHQPRVVEEQGSAGTRTTRRTYTHLLGPYVVGLPSTELIQQAGSDELFGQAWDYDPNTGFRTVETKHDVRTTYTADTGGNVASATTASGRVTSFTYEWGVLKNTTTAAHVTTREINPEGTVRSHTQAGRTTRFTYDDLLRVTGIEPPGGTHAILTDYAADGRTLTVRRGASSTVTTLDGLGRPTATSNSVGVQTATEYDADGRTTFQSYPYTSARIGTRTTYDALGRPTERTNPGGSRVRLSYGTGTVTIQDEENRTVVHTVAAFGDPDTTRLLALRDADGQTWQYTYDALDQLRSVTAPGGSGRTWAYVPGTNRLSSETHPESGTTSLVYDTAGRLQRRTDERGTTFTYDYDGNDRVVTVAGGGQTTTFTYEPGSDNRRTATVDGVVTTFAYDAAGRLAGRTDQLEGNPFQTAFSYDPSDNLTGIEYPTRSGASRRRLLIDYDSEHRPVTLRENGRTYATNVQYHPSGAVTSFQSGNGRTNTFGYDAQRYWPTGVGVNLAPAPWSLTYDRYDLVGNVGRIVDSRPGFTQTLRYDRLDRLTRADGHYGTLSLAYDTLGNRQTAGGTTYTYDPARLWLLQQGSTAFAYDQNGNLISDTARTYTYTPDNQVATVTSGGTTTRYSYDADQWRVKKAVPGQPTIYTIRGPRGEILTEWRTSGTTARVKDFISLGTRLVATVARDLPEPPPPTACTPVIRYDFTSTPSPLYPTNSPGGPTYSLPNYWQTPVWPNVNASLWGPPISTFPNLLTAERTDIVNGQLSYVQNDPVIAAAVFGQADPAVQYRLAPLFSTHNNRRTIYAEADVDFKADVYNQNLLFYAPLFRLFGNSLFAVNVELVAESNGPPSGPIDFRLVWDGLESGGNVIAHSRPANTTVGQTVRVRLEVTPSTPVDPTDPQNFSTNSDGVIRLLFDGTPVYQTTTASVVLQSFGLATMPEAYNAGGIALGHYGFAGAYNNLDFGYCTAPGL